MNALVSDQAGRLAETPPALWAAVGALVGVHAELVPPEVRDLLEKLPTILTRVGTDRVNRQHHRRVSGANAESWLRSCRSIVGGW